MWSVALWSLITCTCMTEISLAQGVPNQTGIITPPLNTTCWSNQQAQFTCEIIEVPFKRWRVNGSTISEIDGFEWYLRHSQDSDVLTLNVTCRPEYNGTDVECVARYENWTEEKKNAVLIVQGLLASVSNLTVKNSSIFFNISWSAPFSLDVSGEDPDIWYTVLISNVTDEDYPTAVPCADYHNLTQTHYTFNPDLPSPCHKYTFTVTTWNGAGQGESSQPVTGVLNSGADFSIEKASTRWKSLDSENDQVIIRLEEVNGSKDVCSYEVFVHTNPAINESVMPTTEDRNSLTFTTRPLDRDKVYDVMIEAKISLRNVKSSVQLKISTYDVQVAIVEPIPGGVAINAELAENTKALGCFIIVQCQSKVMLPEKYRIALKNDDGKCSATVPDLKAHDNYTIFVYDLESDGRPGHTPAVTEWNVSVEESSISSGGAPTASVVSDISIRYSSDLQVEISCNFDPERRVENECIIVWHKKGKAWLNSTVQSMGSPPSVIEVRDEGEYLFTVFGKQGNILDLFPVFQEETYIPTHLDGDNTGDGRRIAIIIAGTVVLVVVLLCFAGTVGIAVWIWRRRKFNKLKAYDSNRRYKTEGHEKEGERDGFAKQPSIDGPAQFHDTDFKNKLTKRISGSGAPTGLRQRAPQS